MPDNPLDIPSFAKLVRDKDSTGAYKDIPDDVLVKKTIAKYPDYADKLNVPVTKLYHPDNDREDLINYYSTRNGVDPELTRRIVGTESKGNKSAKSWAGAGGLMQLMPGTAKQYGVTDPNDAHQNLDAGTKYFRSIMDQFDGDPASALAGYNAGPDRVKKYGLDRVRKFSNFPKGDKRRGGYAGSTGAYVDGILHGYQPADATESQPAPPTTDLGQGSSYTQGGTGATRPRSVSAAQPTVTTSPQDHVAAIAANAPRPVTLGGAPQPQVRPQPKPQVRQQRPAYSNNIDWHFGLSQQEFNALTPQQKAIAFQVANKASAEDQQKKDSGQTVEKSADYQASNRQRLGLKPQSTNQQASQAPTQDAVSSFYDSVQKNFAPALQSTTPEQDARIQAATELDDYEAQPDNTGQRRLDKTQRAAAIKKRATEIIDSRQAAAVEGESNAGSKVASVVRRGLQQFGNAPMGVPLEALPGGHYVKDKLTSYGEGVAGAVGGTVKQLGNAADIINKYTPVSAAARALSPRVKQAQDEGYNRARNVGSQIQSGAQQSEELHPATGTADELVQGLARGAGGTTIEVPKLILGGTLLGAANLPVQGALSRYEEGAAGMVKGAAGGLVYHYGGGVTGPALGTVGNALFWTLAPAGMAVAGGESAGKAIGEALPMGAFMLHGGEGKESIKKNGLPVSVKEADGTVRSATKEDIAGIAKGELDVVPPPDPRQMNLTQRRSLGIGNIDVRDPQLKPRGEKQRRVAQAKAKAVSDQLDAKARSRAANQPEPVQTSLDLNQPTETTPTKPTAPLLRKRVATPVEKELSKSLEKEFKERRSAERLAETDKLTGLPDVRALDKALPTAEADPNTKIVSFDFNDFKNRNKMFGEKGGEDSGDAHLKKGFAAIDAAAKANGGRAFRHGGDEGTVIVTGTSPQEAEALATKIRDEAEAAYGQNPYEGVHPQTGKQVSGSTSFSGVISDRVSSDAESKDVAVRLQTRKGEVKGTLPKAEPAKPAPGALATPEQVNQLADLGVTISDARNMSQADAAIAISGRQQTATTGSVTFKTAKGSTYTVNEDGTTTRNKSFHPEHGPKDVGPQPKSQATYYVSVEDANKLGEIQTEGPKRSLVKWTGTDGKSYIGIRYEEGKDKGKVEHRTAVTYSTEPSVGKMPVEVWKGGKDSKNVHFGNKIVSVDSGKAAPVEPTAPEKAESKGASFHHTDFGSVTESNNQTGIPKGSVRVTDEQGAEHVIKRPSARGKGNQRAVPVKETAPTEAPYKYQPLDVSKDVAGTTMYHGTKSPIEALSEADPAQFASTDALYGHGLYLTDNPEVAKGYAETKGRGASGKVLSAELGNVKLLDLEQPLPTEVQRVFDQVNVEGPGDRSAATGKEVFSKLKAEMADAGITKSDATEIYQNLTTALQDLGYDGFRHEGGALKGKEHGPHNVAILFPDYGVGKSAKELLKVPGESGASAAAAKTVEEPAPPVSEQIKGITDRMKQQAEREQSRTDAPYVLDSRTGKPSTEVEASGKSVRGSSHHILIETKDGTQRITAVGTKVPMKTVDAVRDSLNNSERSKVVANAMRRAMDESRSGQAGSARLFAPFESLFNKGYDLYLDGVEKYAYWKEAARLKKIAGKDVSDRVLSQTFKAIDSAVKEVRAEAPKTPTKAVEPPQEAEKVTTGPELPQDVSKVTGVRKSIVEAEREARGLPPVEMQNYKTLGPAYLEGRANVLSGAVNPTKLADAVATRPRPLTAEEVGALAFDKVRIDNRHDQAVEDFSKAKTNAEKAEARKRMFDAEDERNVNNQATRRGGRELSAGLNAMKIMVDKETYQPIKLVLKAKALRGEDLPQAEHDQLIDLGQKITKAQAAIDSYEVDASASAAQKVIDTIQKQVDAEHARGQKSQKRAANRQQLDQEFQQLGKLLAAKLSPTRLNMGAMFDPTLLNIVRKMAVNRVKAGFNSVDGLVDEVRGLLEKHGGAVDRRDVMDAISGYGETRKLTQEPDAVKLRDLKRQMRLISSIEDVENGVKPARSGVQIEKDSKEAAALRAKLKELVGEKGMRDPLPAIKTRLTKQISALEEQLKTGDFSKKARTPVVYDKVAQDLRIKRDALKHEADQALAKQRRVLVEDWFLAYQRGSILSGPISIPKLGMAAAARIFTSPVEEVAGAVLSKLPVIRKVSARAPREGGGLDISAEVKSAVAALTSLPEAKRKLLTGKNKLDLMHGHKLDGPDSRLMHFLEFSGRVHGAEKTPAQMAEYERSLEKRLTFAKRNGENLRDPLVIAKAEYEAYQDSHRAILLQDNLAITLYKSMLNRLDHIGANPARRGEAKEMGRGAARVTAAGFRYMLPIVKVPTNFAKETFDYSTVGAPAMIRLADVMLRRGGIDKLTPTEADTIMRGLKKGGVGAAVSILGGTLFHKNLSGFYQPGEEKKFKKGHIGRFEYDTGAQFGPVKIPKFLMHAPAIEAMQVAATFRDVLDKNGGLSVENVQTAGKASAIGLAKEVPFLEETYHIATSLFDKNKSWSRLGGDKARGLIPISVQQGAEMLDVDENGERVKRKPEGFTDTVQSGVPWLRNRVQSQGQADFVSGMKRKIAARNRALLKH